VSWTDPERSPQRRLIRAYHAERNSRTPRFYALINKTVFFRSLERRPPGGLIVTKDGGCLAPLGLLKGNQMR
jgi:hypothetical protein